MSIWKRQTAGYLCGDCEHIWDAWKMLILLDDVLKHGRANSKCPTCQSKKVNIVMPWRYRQLKAERGIT